MFDIFAFYALRAVSFCGEVSSDMESFIFFYLWANRKSQSEKKWNFWPTTTHSEPQSTGKRSTAQKKSKHVRVVISPACKLLQRTPSHTTCNLLSPGGLVYAANGVRVCAAQGIYCGVVRLQHQTAENNLKGDVRHSRIRRQSDRKASLAQDKWLWFHPQTSSNQYYHHRQKKESSWAELRGDFILCA